MGALGENVIFGLSVRAVSGHSAPKIELLILKRMIVHIIIWNILFAVEILKITGFGWQIERKK